MDKLNRNFVRGNILKAEELNELVGKINEFAKCVNDNSLETNKAAMQSLENALQEVRNAGFATVDDVKEMLSLINGSSGGGITVPVESEFGDSLFKAISQRFFTDKVHELNDKIDNKGSLIASFSVEDGCLIMDKLDGTNSYFTISEDGNLMFGE